MEHQVFHDLSLKSSQLFQMDHLFQTSSYSIIFETKNISGKLRFQENPKQLIRIKANGEMDAFECPAAQVRRKCELLGDWFQNRNINMPIYGAVILAFPKQLVELAPKKTKIFFPSQLPSFIRTFPQEKKPLGNLKSIAQELAAHHQPYIPEPICQAYDIPRDDILTGVKCQKCGTLGMKKIKRSWACGKCGHHDQYAHIPTIIEWYLVVGENMTNKDCRNFLHVDMKTATRILQSMELLGTGGKRNRTYQIDFKRYLQKSTKFDCIED